MRWDSAKRRGNPPVFGNSALLFNTRRSGAHGARPRRFPTRQRARRVAARGAPPPPQACEGGRENARGARRDGRRPKRRPRASQERAESPGATRSPDVPHASHGLACVGRLSRVSPQTRHRHAAKEGARFTTRSARKDERPTRTEQVAHQAAARLLCCGGLRFRSPPASKERLHPRQ